MKLSSATLVGLVALIFFVVLPFIVSDWVAADFGIYFAYALFAVSLCFVWGHAGLLSLGHAVYFGIGAYAMSLVTLGMVPGLPELHSTWVGLAAAIVLSTVAAAVVGWFFFANRGLKGAFLGIVTVALAVIVERLAINSSYLGGMNGLMSVPPITLGLNGDGPEIYDPLPIYYIGLTLLAVAIAAMMRVSASRFGVSLAALRENELRLWTLGHDVAKLKIAAFALSGGLAGLAGAFFVVQFGFAAPSLIGFSLSADVLIWVALGGRNALIAAALGAVAVRFLESRLSNLMGATWPLVLGMVFMASVIFFPKGIFGELIDRLDRWRDRANG
ncbi:branched-chain amino acid ABC transporter permease [Kaistia dalseonensis]|uniref:ABC-type branched-subunit amino acid transport system permease subunit n=1 Tax=Kaistia dalseonensis TaxID=410840 RepID=A0ABU0H680_9HYPH|nr:branched-chain amino acid ABC transporter permease [Kaistia dalseonensis]MCX5494951.1 branched-chain amino acid ABC transporter permease [Kaistia dalseonensis]MDQ0437532.1 ABC-type branched-subunit amino acid transport system permease subunit [Kaistia dalseonensis]